MPSAPRFLSAEFMYRPRPTEPRARRVFDYALAARLSELSRYPDAAVLLICDREATAASLAHLPADYPRLAFSTAFANPPPLPPAPHDPYGETPARCGWPDPSAWRRYALTDRWARISYALAAVSALPADGRLIMPAHDAVWGAGLLERLAQLGDSHGQNGLPAAVSPATPYQHSAVPGAEAPAEIIAALNAAFAGLAPDLEGDAGAPFQAFWGKMGIIPFGLAAEILRRAETFVWEDDLEIDRVIREAGYGVFCQWIDDPALYRQVLPVFDRAGLKAVIERTLHYSLNIPGDASQLTRPLAAAELQRRQRDPQFALAYALAQAVIAECRAEIDARLARCGQSWVDWGAYRYVVRVGDPLVQVWRYEHGMVY